MNTMKNFPEFDKYACVGNTLSITLDGYSIDFTLHRDYHTSPDDFDCYTNEQIAAWQNDEWFFAGIAATASYKGVYIGEVDSLWGVEINLGDNSHASGICFDMLGAALSEAKAKRKEMIKTLSIA
jgi:hypothetical protein